MGIFSKKAGGFMDQIRCDEPSYLIWKWRPTGSQPGSNRENAIRRGSSLRVKDGEVAVFVYKQKDGTLQDFIVGPFDEKIKTANLPGLASIVGLAYDGGTPFQAEIYFINLAKVIQIRFGIPYFDIFDPRFLDFSVPVAVRGTITFQINDYREFIRLHRLNTFDLDAFQLEIRDVVSQHVKSIVANAPAKYNVPVLQIERYLNEIILAVNEALRIRLKDDFGISVSGIDIGTIDFDQNSPGYKKLMQVTADIATQTIQAQSEVNIKEMFDKQRIEAENYAETLRIQREEEQYAQHKQTQSANFSVYQIEAQTEVGVAAATALGNMDTNSTGDSSGNGFNPVSMMAGMAIGGTMGQNIANTMNSILSATAQPAANTPPIPDCVYHVAINGRASGPFGKDILSQMILSGQVTENTLVWTTGMADWAKAQSIPEIRSLFNIIPPQLPQE